jgi:hypothetical protein
MHCSQVTNTARNRDANALQSPTQQRQTTATPMHYIQVTNAAQNTEATPMHYSQVTRTANQHCSNTNILQQVN